MRRTMHAITLDLDGTLVHTRPIIEEAYRLAGTAVPSHVNVMEVPGLAWLQRAGLTIAEAREVHRLKNAHYLRLLPQAQVNHPLLRGSTVPKLLLTNAPRGTLQVLRGMLGRDWPFVLAFEEMSIAARESFIRALAEEGVTGYAFDDRALRVPPSWTWVHVNVEGWL